MNGLHNALETAGYVVFEAGNHLLADGTQLEVGSISTAATVGKVIPSPTWETVTFTAPFDVTPVVVSQPQTLGVGNEAFLSTRQNAISSTSFDVALQQEEVIATPHGTETIGYLAIEPGSGTWNSLAYEAQTTGAQFTETFNPLSFSQPFSTLPSLVGSLSSFNGTDNAHLRQQNLSTVSIDLKIEEDTTRDTELLHSVGESVSYLALGGEGSLTSIQIAIGDGQTETFAIHVTETGTVNDVRLTLDLLHPRLEDLDVFLEAPDGTTVELFTDVGGDGNHLTGTTLDDAAPQSIISGSAPFTGRFQPEELLRTFQGKSAAGTWTLHVTDDTVNGEVGTVVGVVLSIALAPAVVGNVNHDSQLDADDIDVLFANLGESGPTFDLDHDGDSDHADVDELVLDILGKRYGDTDLDQDVDFTDIRRLVINHDPLGLNGFSSWRSGNFDGDSDVDMDDYNQLVANHAPNGYPPGNLVLPSVVELDSTLPMGTSYVRLDVPTTSRADAASDPTDVSVAAQPLAEPIEREVGMSSFADTVTGSHGWFAWDETRGVRSRRMVAPQNGNS